MSNKSSVRLAWDLVDAVENMADAYPGSHPFKNSKEWGKLIDKSHKLRVALMTINAPVPHKKPTVTKI